MTRSPSSMEWSQPAAELFVPDALPPAEALARTTHLAIGSHQDDLELMTWHGILACRGQPDQWFAGVVVTDGAGSPRAGRYAGCTDDQMRAVRAAEQRNAARIGGYGALVQLGFSSDAARSGGASQLADDLGRVLAASRPTTVYTHSLFDGHDTHVAVALHVIDALRRLPREHRPERVYGCEVWCSLEWLREPDRVAFDVGGHDHLTRALIGVHDSQIAGGKRYDRAAFGRRRANATFHHAREVDGSSAVEYAMDLTPLIADDAVDVGAHVAAIVERFAAATAAQLRRLRR